MINFNIKIECSSRGKQNSLESSTERLKRIIRALIDQFEGPFDKLIHKIELSCTEKKIIWKHRFELGNDLIKHECQFGQLFFKEISKLDDFF